MCKTAILPRAANSCLTPQPISNGEWKRSGAMQGLNGKRHGWGGITELSPATISSTPQVPTGHCLPGCGCRVRPATAAAPSMPLTGERRRLFVHPATPRVLGAPSIRHRDVYGVGRILRPLRGKCPVKFKMNPRK